MTIKQRSMSNDITFTFITGWRTASLSFSNGNCVEVGIAWRKPSRSNGHSMCVEAGSCCCGVAVRDSKDCGSGPVLIFAAGTWSAFTAAVRTGGVGH